MTSWIGKVAGALLGYIVARFPGAVIGLVLGHQFDRGLARPRPGRSRRSKSGADATAADRQRVFFETTFLVMGHLAKIDGRVSEAEIGAARSAMQRLRLDERQTRIAMQLFTMGKQAGFPVDEQVGELRRRCAHQPELLRTFLELQLDLALAKGDISAAERDLLGRIADILGLGRLALAHLEALARARRHYGPGAGGTTRDSAAERAYATLGIEPAATDSEVKTAYRRLMNQHHPDKQAARGLPDSMLEIAKERTAEIRAAYDVIREQRGLK